jgi:hypothetical protein
MSETLTIDAKTATNYVVGIPEAPTDYILATDAAASSHEEATVPEREASATPDGDGPDGPSTPERELSREYALPLHPVTRAILDNILMRAPGTLIEGTGNRRRLTEELKGIARDGFFTYLADAGSPESLSSILDELNRCCADLDGEYRLAVRRFTNALSLRLAHFNAGHEVAGSSTPITLERLAEALDVPEEEPVAERGDFAQEDLVRPVGEVPEAVAPLAPPEEATDTPTEAPEEAAPGSVLSEDTPAEAPAIAEPPPTPDITLDQEVPLSTNPITRALQSDALFTEGRFAMPTDMLELIGDRVRSARAHLERIRAEETGPWYTRFTRRMAPDERTRTESNEQLLQRRYPRMASKDRAIMARQLASVVPVNADSLSLPELMACVRGIEVVVGVPTFSVPRTGDARPDSMSRRMFLRGAALATAAGAVEVATGFPGTKSVLRALWGDSRAPSSTAPVAAAGETAPGYDAAARAEAERQAALHNQALLDAQEARLAEERRLAEDQRLREEQARAEAQAAEEERQRLEREARAFQEAKEAFLDGLSAVGGRGVHVAGEQGNYAGVYGPLAERPSYDDEAIRDFIEIKRLFEEKRAEFGNRLRVTLPAAEAKQWSVDVVDYDDSLARAREFARTNGGGSPALDSADLARVTESIAIAPGSDMKLEISAVELDGDRVRLRWENTYVGDGKVHPGEPSGVLFLNLSREEAKLLLAAGERGTSTAFFAVSSDAYVHNAGNAMRLIGEHCKGLRGSFDAIDASHLAASTHDLEHVYGYQWGRAITGANGRLSTVIAGGACGGLSPAWEVAIRTLEAAGLTPNIRQHQNHSAYGGYTPGFSEASSDTLPFDIWREATMYAGPNTKIVNAVMDFPGALTLDFQELYRAPAQDGRKAKGLFVMSGDALR